MPDHSTMDLMARITILQNELSLIGSNMNIFIKQVSQDMNNIKSICTDLQWKNSQTSQNCDNIQDKVNKQLNTISNTFKEEINHEMVQHARGEQMRIEQIKVKMTEFDGMIEKIQTKLEQKSNDRYIASIIQNSLLNDKELAKFILDQTIKLASTYLDEQVLKCSEQLDTRLNNNYYTLQSIQSIVRKQEKVIEELLISQQVTKDAVVEYQQNSNKKYNHQINSFNQFQDIIQSYFTTHQNQFDQIKQQSQQQESQQQIMNTQMRQQLEQLKKDLHEQLTQINGNQQSNEQQLKQQLNYVYNLKNEIKQYQSNNDDRIMKLQQQCDAQQRSDVQQHIDCNNNNKQISEDKQIPLQKRALRQQINNQQQKQISPNKQMTIQEQLIIIEQLYKSVTTLYKHLDKQFRYHKQSDDTPQLSTKEILIQDNADATQNSSDIKIKLPMDSTSPPPQTRDEFNDSKIFTNNRPLYIVGKQQQLDIRPIAEMSALQQKIKQVVHQLGEIPMKKEMHHSFTNRPNSASRRLPNINQRSLHVSFDG